MNKMLLVLFVIFSIVSSGQQQEVFTEVYELSINDSFEIEDYKIKFVDILSDSRCPKAVMCIVAGEADIVVEVYRKNTKIDTKTIRFTPTVYLPNSKGNIFNSGFIKITGVELYPHPISDNSLLKSEYKLKFVLEEILQ